MKQGDRLVVVGQGGAGGPAAMLAKRMMREVDVTIIREEKRFIVR
jgi:D-arabinose 1-dehydrogenase-like Zn-dependent alcohol dehydrogenase